MDKYMVFYAASMFICATIFRQIGYKDGYRKGLSDFKKTMIKDMETYPTKWKFLLSKYE